ncbi:MAG: efflux RND transporter periplasmic adaptor subunit [Candidatus Cryptobacteroides sp.]
MKKLYPMLALLCIVAAGCSPKRGSTKSKSEAICVRIQDCKMEDNVKEYCYVGNVDAGKRITVKTNLPGTVEEVLVKTGQKVGKGDAVAVLSSESIESSYAIAKATLDRAQDGYDRALKVKDSGSISEVKLMEIQTQLQSAIASEKAAKAQLENLTVRAPYDATVGEVHIHEGEKLALMEPVAQLVDINSIEVHINIPEKEYSKIKAGQKALLRSDILGRDIEATVLNKGLVANKLSHSYDCTVIPDEPCGELMPGMVCKVYVHIAGEKGIVIPARAVDTDNSGRFVWIVDREGNVEKRHIVLDGYSGQGIIVKEGLSEADRIIVKGGRKVSAGMKVKSIY